MNEFSNELAKGLLLPMLVILGSLFIFTIIIIIVRLAVSWVLSLIKEKIHNANENNRENSLNRKKWAQELTRQDENAKKEQVKMMAKWRKLYGLGEQDQLYLIGGTELYTPYIVDITEAERDLLIELEKHFNKSCIMVDCYFKTANNKTVQIDSIAINEHGIFIFESKDYAGWIFGNGSYSKWTQVLAYGREKYHFYNPIKQNANHVAAIKKLVGNSVNVYSVVVFSDRGKLKDIDFVPKDTYVCSLWRLSEVLNDIKNDITLSQSRIMEIRKQLQTVCVKPSIDIRNKHVDNIKEELGTNRVYK